MLRNEKRAKVLGLKIDDEVTFKDGRAKGRTFVVGGVNDKGLDVETNTRKKMISVTFRAFGRGVRMDCVADEMVKVAGDD